MRRSDKFRLRPAKKQEAALTACLEATRQLYSAALEERREAWRMGRHRVTFYSQDGQLKEIRAEDPERYGRWSSAGNGGYAPNGAAAKAGLNRSINDAGWGIFLRVLSAKAESAGWKVIAVNPRHTSQRCTECGHTTAGNPVTQAEFRCLACGYQAHADGNAAGNILRAGLALQEALEAT